MEVTKENAYYGKMLKKLVDNVVSKNNNIKKYLLTGESKTLKRTSSILMN
jgi:hypothetical protein